ncbi:DNA damage-regulated autophagy modulator protein 1 isoform X2 [Xiphias gladius]|uniref:DNA damage-regulated autophagy modulator protein 1 isoform X2 n=1 Tax=Xiphias gladius TaxID=8245 RepID=UPI001A98A9AE|nr:DNA damage-regulated autophagy modulator protein 1 isoform X2 [Xiphias gladius]
MFWFTQGLCSLPVFLVIWSSSTFIISYLIAIFRHDVDVLFPYISDTGANPPESCIFGLMTFISSGAGIATIYARYKFVEKLSEETRVVSPRLNKAALVLGVVSCLSMCIVATFQETTVTEVHDLGALLFFVSGVLYIVVQSVVSYHAYPYGSSAGVCRARLGIAVVAALAFFPSILPKKKEKKRKVEMLWFLLCEHARRAFNQDATLGSDYPFHVASAVCEWVVAFSFVCFFLTYIDDFKMFTLRVKTEFEELS